MGNETATSMLEKYRPIMAHFLSGGITAAQFYDEFIDTFLDDENQVRGPEFERLSAFFNDVDSYVADPALRTDPGDLDDEQLLEITRGVYNSLFGTDNLPTVNSPKSAVNSSSDSNSPRSAQKRPPEDDDEDYSGFSWTQ